MRGVRSSGILYPIAYAAGDGASMAVTMLDGGGRVG